MITQSTQGLPYDDVVDGKMIEGIMNGDRESFDLLYDRYAGLLFTTIQKVLNDRSDTEEVLQEVMNSLWQKAHLYHAGRGRPVTWLASTARNRAIDRLRAKKRQSKLKDALSEDGGAAPRPDTAKIAANNRASIFFIVCMPRFFPCFIYSDCMRPDLRQT